MLSIAVVFASCYCALAQPSIETNGVNVNVITSGLLQVNGKQVALADDVTQMNTSVGAAIKNAMDQIGDLQTNSATNSDIDGLSNTYATQKAVNDIWMKVNKSIADAQQTQSSATSSLIGDLNASLWNALGDQMESVEAIEENLKPLYGWHGVTYFDNCTVQNCTIGIYGRGFFPSETLFNGTVTPIGNAFTYTVKISPETVNKDYTCPVLKVDPNYIFAQCGGVMTDPPKDKFFTNLKIQENNVDVPYAGAASEEPTQVITMTTDAPTIHTNAQVFSFVSSLSPGLKATPVPINFTSHHDDVTPKFTSNDQSIVKDSNIVYKASTKLSGGTIQVQFTKIGSAVISVVVTDNIGQSSTKKLTFVMSNEFTCNTQGTLKASTCVQNPKDIHWGRNSNNCMALQDNNYAWSPNTGRHVAKYTQGGDAVLSWSAQTLYSIEIHQKNGNGWDKAQRGFDVYVQNGDTANPLFGQWIKIGSCAFGDSSCAMPVSKFTVPSNTRRTTGAKMVRTAPKTSFETFRVVEIKLIGC